MKQVSEAGALWNEYVDKLTASSRSKYPDITIFEPDMYTLFREVSANPKSHPETVGVTNTTGYCEAYARMIGYVYISGLRRELTLSCDSGPANPTANYPECGIPISGYLFMDGYHPQSPMHKAIAHLMADTLMNRGRRVDSPK
jgi:phospholipase/lecithinase/hemolysin